MMKFGAAAALTVTLGLLALAGCGGESGESGAATEGAARADTPEPKRSTERPQRTDGADDGARAGAKRDETRDEARDRPADGDTGEPASRKPPADLAACRSDPESRECGRAVRAAGRDSRTLDEDECYSALSREQCSQLGKAAARGGSRTLDADECYSALSREQCKALGKAYKGAKG